MCPIETLERARVCNSNIDSKVAMLERMKFLLEHLTRREEADSIIPKIESLEMEINAQIDGFADLCADAQTYLSVLPLAEQAVLEQYYINGLDWETVALKTHYSIRKVYSLRKSGLDIIQSLSASQESL